MKVTNISYRNIKEFQQDLDLSKLNNKTSCIQIFTGLIQHSDIEMIQSILIDKNPNNIIYIGTSSAGEINSGKVYEQSITMSIMEFESTTFTQGFFTNDNEYIIGTDIAKSLFRHNTKVAILFIDGLKTNGNDVVNGISKINNTIPIAGGLAGDNGNFIETFIFDRNGIYSKGCVAVAFHSDKLNVFTDYQLNWQAIGQTMTVTKAHKNHLYEIDGLNVSEVYRKYLGKKVGDKLPFSATEFPLLKLEKDGTEVCRTFTHKFEDDGSLLSIGNLNNGDRVRFAFGNIDLVLNNTKERIKNYQLYQPEAIFTYSCTARKAFLQSQINIELHPLNDIAPNCGFFTYGEIFHRNKKNHLLNISLTILGLSEQPISKQNITTSKVNTTQGYEDNFIKNKHFLVLEALTHLSNTVIEELETTHTKLKEQNNRYHELNNRLEERVEEILNERIQQEKILLHQRRLATMGEMLDSIAHQWRQPLMNINAILMNMDRAMETKEQPFKYMEEKIDEIITLTTHMSQTIEDFRSLFKKNKEKEIFDIHEAISYVLNLLKNMLYHIDIQYEHDKEIFFNSYRSEFIQVIMILLNNASDVLHTRDIKDKTIIIRVTKVKSTIILNIEDNARGIEEKHFPHIFDPYFTTKKRTGGSGLGLYIAKIIIEQNMNGKISVKNTNKGVSFKLELHEPS